MQFIQDIELTDNYQGLSYRNNLNDHIVSVLDIAAEQTENDVLKNTELIFSKKLYNECLGTIYENNVIDIDEQQTLEYKKIKRDLYSLFIQRLGKFFNINDEFLVETIDFTVSNYMDWLKYKDILNSNNPWTYSNNILTDDKLLYTFTDNIDEYKHLLKNNRKESELTRQLTIGILAKGKRQDYAQSYIKDIYALRNLLLNFLEDRKHDSSNPLTMKDIINEFRKMSVSKVDLSDSHIKTWIVYPLKKFAKLGSNKTGYFIIKTEQDLYESYMSHYKNYMGFYKTLERHRDHAEFSLFLNRDFDLHNK